MLFSRKSIQNQQESLVLLWYQSSQKRSTMKMYLVGFLILASALAHSQSVRELKMPQFIKGIYADIGVRKEFSGQKNFSFGGNVIFAKNWFFSAQFNHISRPPENVPADYVTILGLSNKPPDVRYDFVALTFGTRTPLSPNHPLTRLGVEAGPVFVTKIAPGNYREINDNLFFGRYYIFDNLQSRVTGLYWRLGAESSLFQVAGFSVGVSGIVSREISTFGLEAKILFGWVRRSL